MPTSPPFSPPLKSAERNPQKGAAGRHRHPLPIIVVGTTLEPLARSALCLMISCAIARVRLRYALKDMMIMLLPMLLVLAATITWPEIPLFLPRLISPEFLR